MALRKRSPAAGEFLFEIDPEPLEECLTALGGIPLLVRAARSLDVPGSVERHLRVKQRERGFDEALRRKLCGVECGRGRLPGGFRSAAGRCRLSELLGHAVPSAEAARKFLYQFHDGEKIEQAQQALVAGRVSYIPEESPALQGLAQVNQDVVRELGRRCAEQKIATLDVDATIIESWKREAKPTYEGSTGYQPVLVLWAEMSVVVGDEFRDGNVPAHQELLPITQRAFQALPETVIERYFRGDSACHEQSLLEWLRDEQRVGGPQGRIGFAVSARMNPALHAEMVATLESRWQPYSEDSRVVKECCEVDYVPEEAGNPYREPLRYVAVRICKKQGALFADGSTVKYFAVVSNVWEWTPKRLLEWHRGKAGSIEAVHDIIKNELAGGVMPCGRFGANAAWLRLAVLTYNLLTALKRLALPPELLLARPKRLRFLIFNTLGKLVHHARSTLLRLGWTWQRFSNWQGALRLLPLPAC